MVQTAQVVSFAAARAARARTELLIPAGLRELRKIPLWSLPWRESVLAAAPDTPSDALILRVGRGIGPMLGDRVANIVLAEFLENTDPPTSFGYGISVTNVLQAHTYAEQYGLIGGINTPRLCLAVAAYLRECRDDDLFQELHDMRVTLVSPVPIQIVSELSCTSSRVSLKKRSRTEVYVCVQRLNQKAAGVLLSADQLAQEARNIWYVYGSECCRSHRLPRGAGFYCLGGCWCK